MNGDDIMAQPKPWLDEIIDVLKELGGHGYYKDIYERMKQRGIMDFNTNRHWKQAIQQSIELHSSDSNVFNGKDNIFYAVEGKGQGHWGLRNFEPTETTVDLTEDDSGFPEGKAKLKQHICRERNPKVIKLAKDNFKKQHGKLYCEVCGFNFEETYGKLGEDFIEGHHTIPVSKIPEGYKTKPEDIVLLCSNCHKMIHRKRPWLSRDKLKTLLKK